MTELKDFTRIEAAMEKIDAGLGDMTDRQMVSTSEVTDLLLDVRMLLSAPDLILLDDDVAANPAVDEGVLEGAESTEIS